MKAQINLKRGLMTARKFVSISAVCYAEDDGVLLAVADDGTAWISDTLISINMASVADGAFQWHPVASLPDNASKALGVLLPKRSKGKGVDQKL